MYACTVTKVQKHSLSNWVNWLRCNWVYGSCKSLKSLFSTIPSMSRDIFFCPATLFLKIREISWKWSRLSHQLRRLLLFFCDEENWRKCQIKSRRKWITVRQKRTRHQKSVIRVKQIFFWLTRRERGEKSRERRRAQLVLPCDFLEQLFTSRCD